MAIKIEKSNKTVKESFSDDLIDNATKELSSLEDTSDDDKSIVSVARPADKAAFGSHKRNLTIERDRLKKAYKDPAAKALNDAHDLQMKEIHDIIKKGGDIIPLSGRHSSTSRAIQEAERFGYSAKGTKKKWKIEAYTGTEKGYRKQLHLYTLDESAKTKIVYTCYCGDDTENDWVADFDTEEEAIEFAEQPSHSYVLTVEKEEYTKDGEKIDGSEVVWERYPEDVDEVTYAWEVVLADDYDEVLYSVEVPSSEYSEEREKEVLAEVMEWAEERERNKEEDDEPIEVITGYYSWYDEDREYLNDIEVVWSSEEDEEDIDESCSKKPIKVKNHHSSSRVLNKGRVKESILAKETNEFELENFTDLKSFCWSGAKERLAWAEELGKENEFFDYIEDIVNVSGLLDEDGFIEDTTLNDLIWFDCDNILEEWENEQKGIESENESLNNKEKRIHLKVFEGSKHSGDKSNLNESFEVVVGIDGSEDLLDYFSHYEEDTLEDIVYKYLDYLSSNDKLEPLYVEVEKRAKEETELTSDTLIDLIYAVAEELYDETPERYEETDEEEPEVEYEEEDTYLEDSYVTTPQKKHIANTEKADLNTYVPEESVKAFWEEIKNKGKEDDLLFVLESSFGDNPTVDNLTELLLNEEFTRDLLDLDEEVEEESHPYNFDDIEFARESEVVENTPTFYFDVDGNIFEETPETDEEESK